MSPCTCDRVGFSNARLYSKLHRIGKPFAFSDGHTTRYRELYTTVSGSIRNGNPLACLFNSFPTSAYKW